MKRTTIVSLVTLAIVGGVGGGFLETALAAAGSRIMLPLISLGLALLAIGILVIVLARPIQRLTRGKASQPIDPFYATRVLVLAKASALSGALFTGFGAGVLIFLLSRSVEPGVGSTAQAVVASVGAAALLAGGLIAEHMCTIPPNDDDNNDSRTPAVKAGP